MAAVLSIPSVINVIVDRNMANKRGGPKLDLETPLPDQASQIQVTVKYLGVEM